MNKMNFENSLGEIDEQNSFERVYQTWHRFMIEKNLFVFSNTKIIGIKYDKSNKKYKFFLYKNEEELNKDKAFLPHKLLFCINK